jgi:PiT family inorganic phosphate transporter
VLLMVELGIAAAMSLAFVNGANDNMKGVATLYGSGALDYRRALVLASVSTALGSLLSLALAGALVEAFSGKGLVPGDMLTPAYLTSVGFAASATVLVATRLGFPISTTHALVGALTGAGIVAAGSALNWGALGGAFVLPLLLGPLLGLGLAWAIARAGRSAGRRLGIRSETCVCIGEQWVAVPQGGGAALLEAAGASLRVAVRQDCEERYQGQLVGVDAQQAIGGAHLLSASLVGFARGLNDTPKILGLMLGLGIASPKLGALAIAAAMTLGGWLAARRVADTLAMKITPMTPAEGLAGNLATSLLVIGASRLGLPVSTTHVSTGGIFGIGAASGGLHRRMASEVVMAWVVTLPVAAVLAAGLMAIALHAGTG